MGGKKQIESLQALRAIAYTAIFISHAFDVNMFLGSWGVSVFLVMSGFVLTYSSWNREIPATLKGCVASSKKAISQLLPLHIVMLLLVVITKAMVILSGNTISIVELLTKIVCDSLMIQSWIPISNIWNALNGVSWYLSVIVFTTFLFPVLLKRIKRIKSLKNGLLFLLVVFFVQITLIAFLGNLPISLDGYVKWATYRLPLVRIFEFLMGMLLCRAFFFLKDANHNVSNRLFGSTVFEILVIILNVLALLIYPLSHREAALWFDRIVVFTPSVCLLVLVFALNSGWITRVLTNRITIFIGNKTRYAFLIHQVVLLYFGLVLLVFDWKLSEIIVAIISYLFTLLMSCLWEKFMDRRKKQSKNKK